MSETPLSSHIEQVAQQGKSVAIDGTRVDRHSLREVIEADKYLAEKDAKAGRKTPPIRILRIKPGGAA